MKTVTISLGLADALLTKLYRGGAVAGDNDLKDFEAAISAAKAAQGATEDRREAEREIFGIAQPHIKTDYNPTRICQRCNTTYREGERHGCAQPAQPLKASEERCAREGCDWSRDSEPHQPATKWCTDDGEPCVYSDAGGHHSFDTGEEI